MPKLTQARLKELLHYDPLTGDFTWKINRKGGVRAGEIAGTREKHGYIAIGVDTARYRGHRLAFLYMTGYWPDREVDHENHIRNDNKWKNLSEATRLTNTKNVSMPKNNTSGVIGVSWQSKRWRATIHFQGKRIDLGRFKSLKAAAEARKAADIKYGYHENHGG